MDDLTERELQLQARAIKRGKSAEEAEPTRHAQAIEQLGDKALTQRDMSLSDNELAFESDQFSTYVLAVTTLRKVLTASDGTSYTVKVDAPATAGVSQDDELAVHEILADEDVEAYDTYAAQAQDALGQADGSAPSVRLFDIKIVDAQGEKIEIAAPVAVSVDLTDAPEGAQPQVVHFADEASDPDVVTDVAVDGTTVSFEADGFSAYAIVDAPPPTNKTVASLEELAENAANSDFYLSVSGNRYFTNVVNNNNAFICADSTDEASVWHLEPADQNNCYYLTTMIDGEKRYAKNTSGNLMGLVESGGTVFEVSSPGEGKFLLNVRGSTNKWLQWSNGGNGIRLYKDPSNASNSRITFTYADSISHEDDPYHLDGQTFGIAYQNESTTAAALTVDNQSRLAGQDMLMRPNVIDGNGTLLVSKDSDIQEWTFENVSEDTYHLTTMVGDQKKYLTIDGADVTLRDSPDETKSLIKAVPGTGANAGKWHFTVGNRSLNFADGANSSFNAAEGGGTTTWLSLVEKSDLLDDDDFVVYTAKKVSISDTEQVYDTQEIVVYTRVWNDETKRYEYYAVDHDGSLIRCYDVGGSIQWLGGPTNTATWNFIEHTNANGTPNNYYDLQNSQLGEFLAPQVTGGQVTADQGVDLILNGRRYGRNYSTIVSWDDDNYTYAGLKVENGRLVPCPLAEADSFYAAIMVPTPSDEEERPLSTVETVDNDRYGITMKMIDYNNPKSDSRDSVQTPFFGVKDNDKPGMLSTNLEDNGYPTTAAVTSNPGHSLSELYTPSSTMPMMDANHLFIKSTHDESGYFEYDSTQNFAHFNTEGNKAGTFTVYDQLGAIGNYQGYTNKDKKYLYTGTHGQFLPYDDLVDAAGNPKGYCAFTNRSDVMAEDLPKTDPRKGESLYNVGKRETVDYFFGRRWRPALRRPQTAWTLGATTSSLSSQAMMTSGSTWMASWYWTWAARILPCRAP